MRFALEFLSQLEKYRLCGQNPEILITAAESPYRGRLFSVAVARGGRVYGLEYPQETVDWAPRGSWGAESTLSWGYSSRFRPTELKIRVYTLYFEISAQIRKVAHLVPQC